MKKELLLIEGMTCEGCRQKVEKTVNNLKGVNSARISLVSRLGEVELEPSKVSVKEVIKSIDSLGYKASLMKDRSIEDLQDFKASLGYEKRSLYGALFCFIVIFIQMLSGIVIHFFESLNFSSHDAFLFDALIQAILCFIVFVLGRSLLFKGLKSVWHFKPNMYALIAIGSITGFIYSVYKVIGIALGVVEMTSMGHHMLFFDASASILAFMMLGKYLESYGKKIASQSLFDLMKTKPQNAYLLDDKGSVQIVSVNDLKVGDKVMVKPGEQIPSDGVIIKGESEIDESLLTGESLPILKKQGDLLVGGSLNTNGSLVVEIKTVGEHTVFSQMIELLSKIGEEKKGLVRLADKVASYFIPFIFLCSFITLAFWVSKGAGAFSSLEYFMTVLVIACPCALGLATPLAMTISIFGSAKKGFLITDSKALEFVGKIDTVLFDKTGTLTDKAPVVKEYVEIKPYKDQKEILKALVALESQSHHPLSDSLVSYGLSQSGADLSSIQQNYRVEKMQVVPGKGIEGFINGVALKVGNDHFINTLGVAVELNQAIKKDLQEGNTVLFLEYNGVLLGYFVLESSVQKDSKKVVDFFKRLGKKVILLSGDHPLTVQKVADQLGITEYHSQVTPFDKVELVKDYQNLGHFVMMTGDGLNDSLALKQADLSVCMAQGSDISLKSASIVINQNQLGKLPELLKYLMKTNKIIKQNLFWALFYNVITIPLAMGVFASFGWATINPMIGALSMSLSSLIVILNSLRLKYY